MAMMHKLGLGEAAVAAGRILELGPSAELFAEPRHPYTRALIDVAPVPDPTRKRGKRPVLKGDYPTGPLSEIGPGHWVAK